MKRFHLSVKSRCSVLHSLWKFLLFCGLKRLYDSPGEFFSPISERCEVVSTFGVKYSQFSINVKCDSNFNPIWIIILVSRHTGLHKLWYPSILDTSTWSKFGAHGEHGDVFLFSNLGALWFSENLIRYTLHICLRKVKNNLFFLQTLLFTAFLVTVLKI